MFRLTIKELAASKRRLVATALAVILGVAFLTGTLTLTDTVMGTFDSLLAEADAGTDAYIRGTSPLELSFGDTRPRLTTDLVESIRATPGVDQVAVRVTGYAQILDKAGKAIGSPETGAIGMNWTPVAELNPFEISAGRAPDGPGEVVIDQHSADGAGLAVGDRTTVLSSGQPRPATIVGTARFGQADSPGGRAMVLFDDATAQDVLGQPGTIDGIAVTARPGVSPESLVANLAPLAGPDQEVLTGAELTREDQEQLHDDIGVLGTFMTVFAGIALFVGAFIINNTFSIIVTQRTRQMALLRAIGASGAQVRRAVLIEAAVVGLMASTLGIGAGIGVAKALQALLAALGAGIPDGPMVVTMSTVIISMAAGLVVTVVSAVMPARRASRIPPMVAMREVALDRSDVSARRIVTGAVVTAVGTLALLRGLDTTDPKVVGLGAVALFVGVSVFGPVLARPAGFAIGYPMAKLRGTAGAIARQNAVRNPRRTARTAASLMIGVGLVCFITVLAASLKASGAGAFRQDFSGTAVVDSGAFDASIGLSPDLAHDLAGRPGVATVAEERLARVAIDGKTESYFRAYDTATIGTLFDLGQVEGDLSLLGADGMAVKAGDGPDGPHLGDVHVITFPGGTADFTVRAIFDNGADFLGSAFVDLAAFEANMAAQLDSRIYLDAADLDRVSEAIAAYPTAKVLPTEAFITQQTGDIDTLLTLIYALLGLAVIIALLGIANTLALSIHERRRELGLLRAVGMSRAQVRSSVRWESVIIALFGTGLGFAVGTFLAWAMAHALRQQGIDRFVVPIPSLAAITAIAGLAGVASAVLPARRAARIDILKAVAGT